MSRTCHQRICTLAAVLLCGAALPACERQSALSPAPPAPLAPSATQQSSPAAAPAPLALVEADTALALEPEQRRLLLAWYAQVGTRLAAESFGALVTRVGLMQLGRPYLNPPEPLAERETLRINLAHFECVSLVESVLAVARCIWAQAANETCFVRELIGWRYRQGTMGDFSTRLHYFVDWLDDNATRGRLLLRTAQLGGHPTQRNFFYITQHPALFPPLAQKPVRQAMAAIEERLSRQGYAVIPREAVGAMQDQLASGDVVAIATTRPGDLIAHTGIIVRHGADHTARLLHASSFHKRVVLTADPLMDYLARGAKRQGILVAQPLAPRAP